MYFLSYISPSIQGIFLKLFTYHSLCTPYKWFKFSCNRSITKGALLGEQRTSLALSHLPYEDFYETPYHSLGMLYKWYKFGCDWSITRGSLLEEQQIFMAESRLHFK